jgi:uncharacterized membrane protein YphA (DoxX/SURF4 family)
LQGPSQFIGVSGDKPSPLGRRNRTGVPLLIARVLLGFMFIWMGMAKTGYPELILKKTGHWDSPWVKKVVMHSEITAGPDGKPVETRPGWLELGGPTNFRKLIEEYHMFPEFAWPLLNLTAVAMPWVEVLCGVMLILGIGVRGAAGLLLALLLVFTAMIIIRGLRIYHAGAVPAFCAIKFNCGCGGGDVLICHKIPENLTLILLAVIALLSKTKRFCLRKSIV